MDLRTKIKFQKVFPEDDLSTVLKKLESAKHKIIFCLDRDGYIVGTITDGDVRRALISDQADSLSAKIIANRNPLVANEENLISILGEAKKRDINVVPVTKNKKIMYCVQVDEISKKMLSTVVIMAGGLGTSSPNAIFRNLNVKQARGYVGTRCWSRSYVCAKRHLQREFRHGGNPIHGIFSGAQPTNTTILEDGVLYKNGSRTHLNTAVQ